MANNQTKIHKTGNCFFGVIKLGDDFWYKKELYNKSKYFFGTRKSNGQEISIHETEIVEEIKSVINNGDIVTWQQAKVLKASTHLTVKDLEIQTDNKDKIVIETKFLTAENQVVDTFYWIKEEESE